MIRTPRTLSFMPHKRAKRTVRRLEREKRGADLPPSGSTSLAKESIPKSLTRVLHAERVRKSYNEKRVRNDDTGDAGRVVKRRRKDAGESTKKLEIKHGETLAHFNRRVEDDMRVPVAEAMLASRNHARRVKKSETKAGPKKLSMNVANDLVPAQATHAPIRPAPARKTEFDTRPSYKRLNDIVQAPPTITSLPRGVGKNNSQARGKAELAIRRREGLVSMAQKQLMDEEREAAIRRYRELKGAMVAVGMEKT